MRAHIAIRVPSQRIAPSASHSFGAGGGGAFEDAPSVVVVHAASTTHAKKKKKDRTSGL